MSSSSSSSGNRKSASIDALASVRSVEDALGIKIPNNANIIRNLMHSTLYAQDHLVHFYHLHALDWVDVVSALKADPNATSALMRAADRGASSQDRGAPCQQERQNIR